MSKNWIGIGVPVGVTLLLVGFGFFLATDSSIEQGIATGAILALLQALFSVGMLRWAWQKKFFYWVWGSGIFFRMGVFVGTAFVVYVYTQLSLVATLLTMVTATTLFLVTESAVYLRKD